MAKKAVSYLNLNFIHSSTCIAASVFSMIKSEAANDGRKDKKTCQHGILYRTTRLFVISELSQNYRKIIAMRMGLRFVAKWFQDGKFMTLAALYTYQGKTQMKQNKFCKDLAQKGLRNLFASGTSLCSGKCVQELRQHMY